MAKIWGAENPAFLHNNGAGVAGFAAHGAAAYSWWGTFLHSFVVPNASWIAVIVAFNVKPERKAAELAQRENVDIRSYAIIYELLDELTKAMQGLLSPIIKEHHLGRAQVRDTFRVKGVGTIAGCSVLEGVMKRDAEVRVIREAAVLFTGKINSLKRLPASC